MLTWSAYGQNCTPKTGYVRLGQVPIWESQWCGDGSKGIRGVTLFLIDPFSCSVAKSASFDTHWSTKDTEQLEIFLDSVPNGNVVLGLTSDEPIKHLKPAMPALLQLGVDVTDVQYKGSFAFITQKGFPSKTLVSKVVSAEESDKHPAELTAKVTGTS